MKKEDFLQSLAELSPQHVVAYSMGGRLALESLLYYRARFLSLTLLSTTVDFDYNERIKKENVWIEALTTLSTGEFVRYWYSQKIFKGFTPPESRFTQNKDDLLKVLKEYSITQSPCLKKKPPLAVNYIYRKGDPKAKEVTGAYFVDGKSHAIHLECIDLIKDFLQARIQNC